MYNNDSPVIQDRSTGMIQNQMLDIFSPDPPMGNYYPSGIGHYNPNMDYYSAMERYSPPTTEYCPTTSYQQPMYYQQPMMPQYGYQGYPQQQMVYQQYGQPQLNTGYQQQRLPWQLLSSQNNNSSLENPFVNKQDCYGTGFNPNGSYSNVPPTMVDKGFNPFGVDEIWSSELKEKLKDLDDRYRKMNMDKIKENRAMYGNYGYNYYAMNNTGYIDPVLRSRYNTERAQLEAEARRNLEALNMRLSRAAHTYLGDIDMSVQENVDRIMTAYKDESHQMDTESWDLYVRQRQLSMGRDITQECRAGMLAADREVSAYYHSIVSPDADLDEFLQNAGMILWHSDVEKMMKKGATYKERFDYDEHARQLRKVLDEKGMEYDPDDFMDSSKEHADGDYFMGINMHDPNAPFRMMQKMGLLDEDLDSFDDINPVPGMHVDLVNGNISITKPDFLKNNKDAIEKYAKIEEYNSNMKQMNYERKRNDFMKSIWNPPNWQIHN